MAHTSITTMQQAMAIIPITMMLQCYLNGVKTIRLTDIWVITELQKQYDMVTMKLLIRTPIRGFNIMRALF